MIYVKLKKALYGTLKAAVLFWKKLTKTLTDDGFTINSYDWCEANKTMNGTQCTVAWHVDDLKISHKSASQVTKVIKVLEHEYGKVSELTIVRGKVHDFLGIIWISVTKEKWQCPCKNPSKELSKKLQTAWMHWRHRQLQITCSRCEKTTINLMRKMLNCFITWLHN